MLTLLSLAITYLNQFAFFKKFLNQERNTNLCNYPPAWHLELNLDEGIRKVLFVGDVHGCYDELNELLVLAEVNESEDILVVFAGDICNKGPKNIETIRLVRQLGSKAYSVRGNHEQSVLSRLNNLNETLTTQLPKKNSWVTDLSPEDRLFLERLPFTISIPSLQVIVVHGGLVPGVKLTDQLPDNMLNMRNYVHEKLSGSKHIDDGLPWGSQWPGPQFVIFGHDARRHLQRYKHAIGLDTGCLYGLKLTGFIVNIEDENPLQNGQFISVQAHSKHVDPGT